jgi:hypothetical protein
MGVEVGRWALWPTARRSPSSPQIPPQDALCDNNAAVERLEQFAVGSD